MEQTTAFSLRQNRGDQGDPDQSFKLKLKNVHTALVKMDNIGGGGGGGGKGTVQTREPWRLFLKGIIVFSFLLL